MMPLCVLLEDMWCLADETSPAHTACQRFVAGAAETQRRMPTCSDCRAILDRGRCFEIVVHA